jgi:hypothetical protein
MDSGSLGVTILTYSRFRLQIGALLFSFSAFAVIARWWLTANVDAPFTRNNRMVEGIQLEWIYPLSFLIFAAVVGRLMLLMAGDLVAVKALPEGLQVTSFFSRRVIAWDGLIGGHRVNYGNFMHRNRWFNIRYLVDGANRSLRVPLILTKRPSGGQMSLPEKIDRAREEALGQPFAPNGERLPGTGLDHDAAIARYLKNKAEAAAAAAAGPTAQPVPAAGAVAHPFSPPPAGREPNLPPRQPVRPAFGRKGLS